MKVNEIFLSVQGEGAFTGFPVIFVRFSGCNRKCSFCDTRHEAGKEYSEDELAKKVLSLAEESAIKYVVLTGGEPFLQLTQSFLNTLFDAGIHIAIETNGDLLAGNSEMMEWLSKRFIYVTWSPKGEFPPEQPIYFSELKLVDYDDEVTSRWINAYKSWTDVGSAFSETLTTRLFLQPMTVLHDGIIDVIESKKNVQKTLKKVLVTPFCFMSMQTQAWMGFR